MSEPAEQLPIVALCKEAGQPRLRSRKSWMDEGKKTDTRTEIEMICVILIGNELVGML